MRSGPVGDPIFFLSIIVLWCLIQMLIYSVVYVIHKRYRKQIFEDNEVFTGQEAVSS